MVNSTSTSPPLRNIPVGSTNILYFGDIQEGNAMVNFPRNATRSEYNLQSYYKNSPELRALGYNPATRRQLAPENYQPYIAHLTKNSNNENSKKRAALLSLVAEHTSNNNSVLKNMLPKGGKTKRKITRRNKTRRSRSTKK